MDLKLFYQKVRKLEQEIPEPNVVIVSLETSDGGKDGVMTEVRRTTAARTVVENKARLATPEESAEFHARLQAEFKERELARQLELSILTGMDLPGRPGSRRQRSE